jgi:hypothetical protein
MRRLTFALGAFLLWASSTAFADESSIIKIQGEATIVRAGQMIQAVEGARLKEGDVLKTSANGTVDFSMNALAGTRVLPASEVAVEGAKKSEMRLKLRAGQALFNLEKLPKDSSFQVTTPTAIASVRGTQFTGRVQNGSSSTFSVRDDAIQVQRLEGNIPVGEPLTIGSGFSCDATAQGLISRPASGSELTVMEQVGAVKTCS